MARITRKDLKTDKFALEVGHTVDFFEEHRRDVLRYGAIALAVVLLILAIWVWQRHQRGVREEALAQAIQVQEAPIGPAAQPPLRSFPTQDAKDAETTRQFGELANRYSGSDEGMIAEYYLASIAADQGKLGDAEKHYKLVADSGSGKYASLGKLALAQIYFATGRANEGEQLLRSLIDNPTVFVSREEATIALARQLARTKPAEARKLLDPLRTSRPAISQLAIQLYSELPAQ